MDVPEQLIKSPPHHLINMQQTKRGSATRDNLSGYLFIFEIFLQVSVGDRELPFCNEDRDVSDTTKDYIVNRTRPTGSNNESDKILDAFETDQIAWIWVILVICLFINYFFIFF